MRVRKLFAVITFATTTALVGQAAAAAGDPQVASNQPAASPIKNDTGKRVCRVVTPTGSRFTQRVCKTVAEWQKDADAAGQQLDNLRRSGEATLSDPNSL